MYSVHNLAFVPVTWHCTEPQFLFGYFKQPDSKKSDGNEFIWICFHSKKKMGKHGCKVAAVISEVGGWHYT